MREPGEERGVRRAQLEAHGPGVDRLDPPQAPGVALHARMPSPIAGKAAGANGISVIAGVGVGVGDGVALGGAVTSGSPPHAAVTSVTTTSAGTTPRRILIG